MTPKTPSEIIEEVFNEAPSIITNIVAGENKKCSQKENGKECGYFCVSCEPKFRKIEERAYKKIIQKTLSLQKQESKKMIDETEQRCMDATEPGWSKVRIFEELKSQLQGEGKWK